jgi:hypothetical protein
VRLDSWAWCVGACLLACTDRADFVGLSPEPEPSSEQAEQGELLPGEVPGEVLPGEAPPEADPSAVAPREESAFVQIPEASFASGASPVTSAAMSPLPRIVELTAPSGVTNGGSVLLHVKLEPPQAQPRFVVNVAGDTGYHTVRGTDVDGDGRNEIEVEVRAAVQASSLVIGVAPTDDQGNVGAYQQVTLRVVPSGVGDVKVTLSFSPNHDLDLHVFEPSGFEVSYREPRSPSGGQLDLDSGANCIAGVASAENIFWPAGAAPVGEYRVVVQAFEQCERGAIDFTVRTESGGLVETFHRSFADGAEGTSIEVARFAH